MKYHDTARMEQAPKTGSQQSEDELPGLVHYICYVKRPLGRENTTYVIIRSPSWNGLKPCRRDVFRGMALRKVLPRLLPTFVKDAWPVEEKDVFR